MTTITRRFQNLLGDFATEHRGWFVLFFVLPFSVTFDVYFTLRQWLVMKFYSAPTLHEKRVKIIQAQVKQFHLTNTDPSKKMCTARGGWQSISPSLRPYKESSEKISLNLYDILHFDDKNMTLRVEPMVNMGQLSHFLIKKGFTIPVLPEMDDLTCGGLFMGVGIETSSHKFGLFNDTVLEAEIVTATGEVVTCSRTRNAELFEALPWSYGTLGFLTALTLRVIPCQQYVKLWYIPTTSPKTSSDLFKLCSEKRKKDSKSFIELKKENQNASYFLESAKTLEFDFVESLMYSRDTMITMPAKWVDSTQVDVKHRNSIGLWYKPWFYKHVQQFFSSSKTNVDEASFVAALSSSQCDVEKFLDEHFACEFIPVRDYYHRHTKSIFWELEEIIPFGNNPLVRWTLGWALPPKVSFLKLTQTKKIKELYEKSHCIQDMMVPVSKIDEALNIFDSHYGIYPLWICPYRAYDYARLNELEGKPGTAHRFFLRKPENLVPNEAYEVYVDLGAYGVPRDVKLKKEFNVEQISREVEHFVYSVHGFQMLYATSYQTREEFRAMFDHTFYDRMKEKYDPKRNFPEVFEKVCKKAQLKVQSA